MNGVAAARLAAGAARQVPGVGCALVAVLTHHVWQAVTLAAAAPAVAVAGGRAGGGLAAQPVAHTLWNDSKACGGVVCRALFGTEPTYFCSPAAWRCHSNPVCSSGRPDLRCGTGRADTRRSGSRRRRGPTCRCCCYTRRADTVRQARRGCHSNQVSTRRSGRL